MFGAQYLCEQAFSGLKLRKTNITNKVNQCNLNACMRISCLNNIEPDYEKLLKIN